MKLLSELLEATRLFKEAKKKGASPLVKGMAKEYRKRRGGVVQNYLGIKDPKAYTKPDPLYNRSSTYKMYRNASSPKEDKRDALELHKRRTKQHDLGDTNSGFMSKKAKELGHKTKSNVIGIPGPKPPRIKKVSSGKLKKYGAAGLGLAGLGVTGKFLHSKYKKKDKD